MNNTQKSKLVPKVFEDNLPLNCNGVYASLPWSEPVMVMQVGLSQEDYWKVYLKMLSFHNSLGEWDFLAPIRVLFWEESSEIAS